MRASALSLCACFYRRWPTPLAACGRIDTPARRSAMADWDATAGSDRRYAEAWTYHGRSDIGLLVATASTSEPPAAEKLASVPRRTASPILNQPPSAGNRDGTRSISASRRQHGAEGQRLSFPRCAPRPATADYGATAKAAPASRTPDSRCARAGDHGRSSTMPACCTTRLTRSLPRRDARMAARLLAA